MKILSALSVFFLMLIFITSCQKELNFDLSAQSEGTLKADSVTFDCLPSTVNGVYKADSLLGSENYIDVQVDVTAVGVYDIVSDTVNGFSFRGTGTFGTTGLNTVRLYGSGTPLVAEISTFIITYNTSYCLVDVPVIGNANPNAVFTLGASGGNCTGVSLTGVYMQALPTTAANTASLNITVVNPGIYSISSNTANGVTFSASGTLSPITTGITLVASGTPQLDGTFTYTVSDGTNSCSFTVTYDRAATPATFVLGGAPGDCTGSSLAGTYEAGVAMTSANTVTITVDVSAVGGYTVGTNTDNGISFAATGIFTSTGPQNLILFATGTPTSNGTFTYQISGGGSSCSFPVTFTGNPTDFITCKIDGVFSTFNVNATAGLDNSSGPSILSIDGSRLSTSSNPSISIQVIKSSGGSVTAGTFNVNQLALGIGVICDYFDAANMNYSALTDPVNQNQNPGFTVTITSLTATRCIGTFQGQVKDNSGAGPGALNVTEGVFNVPVQ